MGTERRWGGWVPATATTRDGLVTVDKCIITGLGNTKYYEIYNSLPVRFQTLQVLVHSDGDLLKPVL